MRLPLFFLIPAVFLAACAATRPAAQLKLPRPLPAKTRIDLAEYQRSFGYAPPSSNLREVFLALPDPLVADMPVKSRQEWIDHAASDPTNHLFDEKGGYVTWFSDNGGDPIQASCIFGIKVLPSAHYHYVVAIHMVKPDGADSPPSAANTFFLAPSGSQWIDVTDQLLPRQVSRDWYFRFRYSDNTVEAGPYAWKNGQHWETGLRKYDLVWNGDRFLVRAAPSSRFTFP